MASGADLADLGFQFDFQGRVEFQLASQFVEVGALHKVFFVYQQHAGQVHLGGHFRGAGGAGDFGRVEGFVQFGLQPVLQLRVVVEFAELAFDQLALAAVDMTVGFGRSDQRLEDRLAVLLASLLAAVMGYAILRRRP